MLQMCVASTFQRNGAVVAPVVVVPVGMMCGSGGTTITRVIPVNSTMMKRRMLRIGFSCLLRPQEARLSLFTSTN